MRPLETTVPADLLALALRREPAAPLFTQYDDLTGERVELSATTLANWVAKSANLLQDEFDIGPGSTVAVALPVHWQTAAVLLAAWSCGARSHRKLQPWLHPTSVAPGSCRRHHRRARRRGDSWCSRKALTSPQRFCVWMAMRAHTPAAIATAASW